MLTWWMLLRCILHELSSILIINIAWCFLFFRFNILAVNPPIILKIIELMSINIRITLQSRKRLVELYYYTNTVCIVNTYFETNVMRNTVTSTVYEYLRLRYIFSRCIGCNKDVGQSVLRILLRECLANKKNRGEMWTLARRKEIGDEDKPHGIKTTRR